MSEGPVSVSIRPEDIDITGEDGPIEGEVVDRYFQGDRTQYVIDPRADGLSGFRAVV